MTEIFEQVKEYLIHMAPWYVSTREIHDEIIANINQDKLLKLLKQAQCRDDKLKSIKINNSWLWRYEEGLLYDF